MHTITEIPQLSEIPEREAHDPAVLSPAEQADLLEGHSWSRFAVLGDSIAKGMGDPTEGYLTATWAGRIAAALAGAHGGVAYANFARHRAKAAEIRDLQLRPALDFEPELVALLGGGNDVLTDVFDIAPVKSALDDIVAALIDSGATVVTFEGLDFRAFEDPAFDEVNRRLAALNEAVREIAQDRGTVHVDLYSQPWARERYCFSADLMHPTMRAQALCATTTVKALSEHVRKRNDQRRAHETLDRR